MDSLDRLRLRCHPLARGIDLLIDSWAPGTPADQFLCGSKLLTPSRVKTGKSCNQSGLGPKFTFILRLDQTAGLILHKHLSSFLHGRIVLPAAPNARGRITPPARSDNPCSGLFVNLSRRNHSRQSNTPK